MIPNHILDGLGPDDRVAVLAHQGELWFAVHRPADAVEDIRKNAAREGAEVIATHLQNKNDILELVAARERDVGGEG